LIDEGLDDIHTRYHFIIPPFSEFRQMVMIRT